jgi:RNA polymerase sigma-70 factor (ECF subfamily)
VEGRPLEEAALVEQARRGGVDAYEDLVQQYQELAFRTAYVITGDAAEAEDAAQEAFVKAYYALPRFRPAAPFRPWLLQIVANEARNRRKALGRRASLALRAVEGCPSGDAAPSPEAAALAGERRALLLRALNALGNEERTAIACRYFLELSEAEMASALGCPKGTVKSRLSRALARLRQGLAAAEGRVAGVAADGPGAAEPGAGPGVAAHG